MIPKAEPSSPTSDESLEPTTPIKTKRKSSSTAPSTKSSGEKASSAKRTKSTPNGTMTPEIKEALVGHMMRSACSAIKKEELAAELGITKKQLVNAICSGRANLRSKVVKAAREL